MREDYIYGKREYSNIWQKYSTIWNVKIKQSYESITMIKIQIDCDFIMVWYC